MNDKKSTIEICSLLSQPYHVFWKNSEFSYLGYNKFGSTQLGLDPSTEIIGMNDFDIFSQETVHLIRKTDRLVFEKGELIFFNEEVTTKKNTSFTFYGQKIPLFDDHCKIYGLLGLAAIKSHQIADLKDCLSPREHDSIKYLAHGFSVKKIAQKLNVSPRTIETYIERSKIKLNTRTKSELILAFLGKSFYSIFTLNMMLIWF